MTRGRFWLVVVALALFLAAPLSAHAQGRFLRAESAHFIVIGDMNERRLREAAESLESFDTLLRNVLQPTTPPSALKLEVYLLSREAEFRRFSPDASRDAAGVYFATPEVVAAVAIYNEARMGEFATQVLYHEYAHHFMLHHFADAYPAFFVEGFAEFMQTAEVREDSIRIGASSGGRAYHFSERWMNINRILNPDRRARTNPAFYAQSWLATHYLINNETRMQGFRRYLAALENGGDAIEAFTPAFGITPAEFQSELRTYWRTLQGFVIPRGDIPDSQITISRLPASADDLLVWDLRMRRESANAERHEDVERIASIAARYPGDAYAQRVMAGAEIWRLQPARAREILEGVIAANADDAEAHYLMGLSYIIEAAGKQGEEYTSTVSPSRRHFARVTRINPYHAPSLYFYASTFMGTSEPMPDNAIDALIQAHLLAPQVVPVSLNTASVLVAMGMNDEAAPILRTVIGASHQGEHIDYARALLNQAMGVDTEPTFDETEEDDAPAESPMVFPR